MQNAFTPSPHTQVYLTIGLTQSQNCHLNVISQKSQISQFTLSEVGMGKVLHVISMEEKSPLHL